MVTQPDFPSFSRNPNSPALPQGEDWGAAIYCPPIISLDQGEPFALHGALSVPKSEAVQFPGHLLQAAVVLLRGPMPATRSVGFRQLLFDEDLDDQGDLVRGWFNLDLFGLFDLIPAPNRYWVNVSIFQYVSNTVPVEVTP